MAAAGLGCLAPDEEAGTEEEAIEAVKLAIELGNDVNAVDDNGETATHGAAYKNFPRVVALLAEKGARVDVWNRKDRYGWTPLAIAEGHRPGNFKPSPETLEALHRAMSGEVDSPPPRLPAGNHDTPERAGPPGPTLDSGEKPLENASGAR
jgi:ankyrin repeat protein